MCSKMPKSIENADVGPFEIHTAGVIFSLNSSKAMLKEFPSLYRQTDSLYRKQAKQFDVWLPMQPATGEYITGCGEGDGMPMWGPGIFVGLKASHPASTPLVRIYWLSRHVESQDDVRSAWHTYNQSQFANDAVCSIVTSKLHHFLFFHSRFDPFDQVVQPCTQSERSLAYLKLYDGHSACSIPISPKICVVRYATPHVVAIPFVALLRPTCCALLGYGRVGTGEPHVRRGVELVFANTSDEPREEWIDRLVREGMVDVCREVGYVAIPDLAC